MTYKFERKKDVKLLYPFWQEWCPQLVRDLYLCCLLACWYLPAKYFRFMMWMKFLRHCQSLMWVTDVVLMLHYSLMSVRGILHWFWWYRKPWFLCTIWSMYLDSWQLPAFL